MVGQDVCLPVTIRYWKIYKIKVKELGLESEIRIVKTGCVGFCEKGPIVKIMPDNTFYAEVTPDDVDEIVAKDLITNENS